MSTAVSTAAVFSALGDQSRLLVLRKLSRGAALSATTLAEGAPVTRQAIVKHLQVLGAAGLVIHHRQGRYGPDANTLPKLAALCSDCHTEVHANPTQSYEDGWLLKRNTI